MKITVNNLRYLAENPLFDYKWGITFIRFEATLADRMFWINRLHFDSQQERFRELEERERIVDEWSKNYAASRRLSLVSERFFFTPNDGTNRIICCEQVGGVNGKVSFYEVKKEQIEVDKFYRIG